MKRMDRYRDEAPTRNSRIDKNQELYQKVTQNAVYTNITDVVNANAYDLSNKNNSNTQRRTREDYHQMQKYQYIEPTPQTKKELDDFNYVYAKKENKIYDINSVLEEARKNRVEKDVNDEKRKLKNNAYNILSGVNKEELEKYREEKRKRIMTPEEEEMRELIDTIASKTLAGEIDKATGVDLLSDLMATNILDTVAPQSTTTKIEIEEITTNIEKDKEDEDDKEKEVNIDKEVKDEEKEEEKDREEVQIEKKEENNLPDKDPDFYTRSMDLSEKDFDLSDEFKEKTLPIGIKILIVIIVLILIAIAGYFIYLKLT